MHSCIHNWIATCCNSRHLCDFYRPTVKHKCEETKMHREQFVSDACSLLGYRDSNPK